MLEVEVDAACEVAKKSVGHTGRADIFSQIVICLFASGYLRYIVLQYVVPDTLENIELTAYLC